MTRKPAQPVAAWANGAPAGRPDLELALGLLDAAGLSAWYDWQPAAGGIEGLAEALEQGGPVTEGGLRPFHLTQHTGGAGRSHLKPCQSAVPKSANPANP